MQIILLNTAPIRQQFLQLNSEPQLGGLLAAKGESFGVPFVLRIGIGQSASKRLVFLQETGTWK
jgi:hypothetical protein